MLATQRIHPCRQQRRALASAPSAKQVRARSPRRRATDPPRRLSDDDVTIVRCLDDIPCPHPSIQVRHHRPEVRLRIPRGCTRPFRSPPRRLLWGPLDHHRRTTAVPDQFRPSPVLDAMNWKGDAKGGRWDIRGQPRRSYRLHGTAPGSFPNLLTTLVAGKGQRRVLWGGGPGAREGNHHQLLHARS